jgi:hypothetical protein
MPKLLDTIGKNLRVRHYSKYTEEENLNWIPQQQLLNV